MIVGLEGPRLAGRGEDASLEIPLSGRHPLRAQRSRLRGSSWSSRREIRNVFHNSRGTVPLIAADHEGGVVSVLGRAIGAPPTQMAAARAGDARLVERLFAENARRMRACGVNLLLGPVADVNSDPLNPVIGTRSFGEETKLVSSLVSAAVSVSRREGVLTCLKHFPGHGPSRVDSHLELPVLGATLDQLRERDIPPFASGIAAGAETVMIGHIAPLGRALPASLDPEIIGGLLRGELGFGGVVDHRRARDGRGEGGGASGDLRARPRGGKRHSSVLEAGRGGRRPRSRPRENRAGRRISAALREALEVAGSLEASAARIARLIDIAAAKEREFELPGDPGIYREIADKSIRIRGTGRRGADSRSVRGYERDLLCRERGVREVSRDELRCADAERTRARR